MSKTLSFQAECPNCEALIEMRASSATSAQKKVASLLEDNRVLREALEFYAEALAKTAREGEK